jgi:hypothetical protein
MDSLPGNSVNRYNMPFSTIRLTVLRPADALASPGRTHNPHLMSTNSAAGTLVSLEGTSE